MILLSAAATDWADGYFARRRKEVTTLGILLDPIADKLLICAAFISLVGMGLVQAWMVVIIVGRELAVQGLRTIATAEGFSVAVSELGKAKMVLQVWAASLLLLGSRFPDLRLIGTIALWLVVVFSLWSAARYSAEFWRQLNVRRLGRREGLTILSPQRKEDDVAAH